ncbi:MULTISPECIES: DMT family transporter [Photorhabdus]|uniref:Uncharacterized protein n=2 Tax=Photorhabdus asymbiotica TaxID=291112 RepID=C7BLL1_PHOAA|nr:DMT family transporter [Photorhabdus asymbiotica]RKS57183.1 transporter family-2 protein [Photorhabdus asymbiotica]CAQ84458.1 conserved hypothetical protein [Photorhabdus asymbiotica]
MINTIRNILLAIIGGSLLTLMIYTNSILSESTTPFFASWVAHGIGAIVALILYIIVSTLFSKTETNEKKQTKSNIPIWFYLGGIPGAFTVVLAAVVINGGLPLSSTISLGLVGQIFFGLVADHFGLLGTRKRKIVIQDLYVICFVLFGSMLILFGGSN